MNFKTNYLNAALVEIPKRRAFVKETFRTKVIKIVPWAKYLLKTNEGFQCFEDEQEYIQFKSKVKENI